MWYNRTILAAIEDAINALQSKGVSDEIIQFVHTLPNDKKGKAIGALNQNPSMMIDDLKSLFESGYKPSLQEKQLVKDYDPRFQNWALYQYKLQRSNKFNDDPYDDRWEYKQQIRDIKDYLDEIHDFWRVHSLDNPNYNIGTKSLEEAYEDSNEWHRAMTQRGSGKFYLPFKRDESGQIVDEKIVHRFEDGSMMVRVEDPNDLDVEGSFMHHCVGSYADSVRYGDCTIYSLRDKYNHPQVTIEVDKSGAVKQIKGPNNKSVDDDEQVEKIKEFFEGNDSIKKEAGEGLAHQRARDWYPGETYWETSPDEIGYSIHEFAYGPYLVDYGDGYDNTQFSRFGIGPTEFDQDEFERNNLENVNMDELVKETTEKLDKGIREKYEVDDYNFENLAEIIAEVGYNKLDIMIDDVYESEEDFYKQHSYYVSRYENYEDYKKQMAQQILRNNPLLDLVYNFAESFNQFSESVRNPEDEDFERFEDENEYAKKALLKMYDSEFRLKTEIAKQVYENYRDNPIVKKFENKFDMRFILPDTSEIAETYQAPMSLLSTSYEDPTQVRFQDLPEGESFNLARHRKRQQPKIEDDEEELVLPDDFE